MAATTADYWSTTGRGGATEAARVRALGAWREGQHVLVVACVVLVWVCTVDNVVCCVSTDVALMIWHAVRPIRAILRRLYHRW